MGAPTSQARLRMAAEWLSFGALVLGLVLSSSSEVVWRWLGLFTLAAGALIAWFSHLSMRSELERAQHDAEAWRCWLANSQDAMVVLGAPRDGWADWHPRQDEAQGPVVLQANDVARNSPMAMPQNGGSSNAQTMGSLWQASVQPAVLETIYRTLQGASPADGDAPGAPVGACEVVLDAHDKTRTRWWLHRIVACGDRIIVHAQDVSAFRAAQRTVVERETFYRTLVDSLPVGVVARSTQPRTAGQYLVCNRQASELLDVTPEQLIGTKGEHLLPETWVQRSYEQDLQLLRDPRPHHFEDQVLPTRHGERVIDLVKTPVYDASGEVDHILVIVQDVTEQRRAAEQLRLASRVIDETGDAVVVTDAVDRVVMVNPAFLRLADMATSKVIGLNAELLGLSPLRESHLPGIHDAIKVGERWSGESRQMCRDGRQLDTWLSVSTLRNARGAITQHIRVFSDISVLKAQQRELVEQARRDTLTGLHNRRAFAEQLSQAMARARRGTRSLAVLFIDLDGFKAVNDQHGHGAGDQLLVQVARRLQECVRETDTVCRLAGDEFTIILEGASLPDEVGVVCRRIVARLSAPHRMGLSTMVVTPSIGAAVYEQGDTSESLCERADAAMYGAKRGGKATYLLAGVAPSPVGLAPEPRADFAPTLPGAVGLMPVARMVSSAS